jgi:hypothetical protein
MRICLPVRLAYGNTDHYQLADRNSDVGSHLHGDANADGLSAADGDGDQHADGNAYGGHANSVADDQPDPNIHRYRHRDQNLHEHAAPWEHE